MHFVLNYQANLEKNREALTADLICLLDIASRPKDTAELKQHIESFFITGSARIDLIARILDLDNEIGGINYDIPVLEETMLSINEIGKPAGTHNVWLSQPNPSIRDARPKITKQH